MSNVALLFSACAKSALRSVAVATTRSPALMALAAACVPYSACHAPLTVEDRPQRGAELSRRAA